ncbi:MAG: G-D-S-L family lipolytic protein [Bacteroidetes bacterium]|nr:MAG: G-D-S-L family lipolytic protein [Bacteroidota bacterium]
MRYTTLLTAILLFFFINQSFMYKPARILFFGDSITELGVQPGGYIVRMREALPAEQYELIGAGIGGNKVYDLYLRLEDDVLAQKPDQVFVFVGVNDVWHKSLLGTGTDADKFERFYSALIKKMQAQGIQLVLCTPLCIGEKNDCSNPLDGELNLYSGIIRKLAVQYDCTLCDLRQVFLNYSLEHNPENKTKGILTYDGVHLSALGNQLVAEEMLKLALK